MNTFKKIIFVVVMAVLIVVSMCPISAFGANINPIVFPCHEPYVSSTSGYIAFGGTRSSLATDFGSLFVYSITPIYNSSMSYVGDTPLFIVDDISVVYGNRDRLYFSINGDEYTTYNFSYYFITSSGDFLPGSSFTFTGNLSSTYLYFSDSYFDTEYMDCHGNIDLSSLSVDSYPPFNYLFTENSYNYFYLGSIYDFLVQYGDLSIEEKNLLQDIVDSNNSIDAMLSQIKTEFASKFDTIINDNVEFKQIFRDLLSSSNSIFSVLDSFYQETVAILYLIESDLLEIWVSVDDLEGNTDEIESLLQQILDSLNGSGDTDFSELDTSALDRYYEAESNLMDKVQLSAPMNIDINRNALTFCWNTVEYFLNSNGKVLTAVFVVLTLGLIALALGR